MEEPFEPRRPIRTVAVAAAGLVSLAGCGEDGSAGEASERTWTPAPAGPCEVPSDAWVLDPAEAAACLEPGRSPRPALLDARGAAAFLAGHVRGARRVRWEDFAPEERAERGKLVEDRERAGARLRALGVSGDRPALVYGDPEGGWGEEGRVVWMLRALGHPRAAMVDGGFEALRRAGAPVARGPQGDPPPGDFRPADSLRYAVDREAVRRAVDGEEAVIVDTRSQREYRGATPYGEARGGHVPGAVHLHWRELLDGEGRLLPADSIRARLASRGIRPDTPVYAYCSGGVRSGWLVAVLEDLGYRARNYPGSMWEWSAGPPEAYPLR